MDEWAFITMAKTKSDLSARHRKARLEADLLSSGREHQKAGVLTKIDAALALDYEAAEQHSGFRGVVAFVAAAVVNAAFFGGIELTALDARTPSGEVLVADFEAGQYGNVTASLR